MMVKDVEHPDGATLWKYNTTHAHFTLDNQGYRHTLRIRNTYCFSTPTVVTRTRLILRLYVHLTLLFIVPDSMSQNDERVWGSHRGLQCGLSVCYFVSECVCWHVKGLILHNALRGTRKKMTNALWVTDFAIYMECYRSVSCMCGSLFCYTHL